MVNLATAITRALGSTKLFLLKNAPQILTYGGVAVTGVGIFLFCKATRDLDEKIDDHRTEMEKLKYSKETNEITAKEANRLIFAERRRFTWKLFKLYSPAVTTTVCGFAMILGGHHIISKRSAALSAAYKALEEGYSRYRSRVREDLGEEADRKYMYGLEEKQVEATVKDDEGNEKLVSRTVILPKNGRTCSEYARFFDEFSTQWTRNPEYNLMFLNAQQNYANDKLHATGHLFLNEVYEMLGMPHTEAGSVVGWVLNGKDSDNCVDFGIYDLHDRLKRMFVDGYEPNILLDFNVDGVIYNLI